METISVALLSFELGVLFVMGLFHLAMNWKGRKK